MSTAQKRSKGARPQFNNAWLVATILLPFAAGYHLSYIFRTINAVIVDQLVAEIGVLPAELGLLTSMYFLVMVAVQMPIGTLLDRHGPRRLQAVLLPVAALGACVFALAESMVGLFVGRLLIGLGVSAALMAGLKAVVLWFPSERIGFANGLIVTAGALGAVVATAPAHLLIDALGWRAVFLLLAALTIWVAAIIFLIVPEKKSADTKQTQGAAVQLRRIYCDARFWRLAPVSAACIGTSWAYQGLWATPWLAEVEGLDHAAVIRHLFVMGLALSVSAIALGALADRLRRRGIATEALFAAMAAVFMLAQLALILRWPIPLYLSWALIAMAGAATVLSYAILPGYFPKEASGRANAALNMFHLGVAFGVQWLIGVIIDQWPSQQGRHPIDAYQVAFALNLVIQAIAFAWFVLPQFNMMALRTGNPIPSVLRAYDARPAVTAYRRAHLTWLNEVGAAQLQVASWRNVALASIAVCVVLTTLALPRLSALRDAEPSPTPTRYGVVMWPRLAVCRQGWEVAAKGILCGNKYGDPAMRRAGLDSVASSTGTIRDARDDS
jgi:predicted MFS family arabinose efflux permease